MIEPSRRTLLTGLISLVAAPAIVRAGSLMPVRSMLVEPEWVVPPGHFLLEVRVWWPQPDGIGSWVVDQECRHLRCGILLRPKRNLG